LGIFGFWRALTGLGFCRVFARAPPVDTQDHLRGRWFVRTANLEKPPKGGTGLPMTKTKRALITSAAIAGLLAGSGAAIQASTVVATGKASFTSMQDTDKKDSTKVKEKHACKGQNSCKGKGGCKSGDNGCKGKNSCKGKGGCATDGSKMPDEKKN